VRTPGQPLPEIAFEQPKPDLPGLLWLNRPAGEAGQKMPDLSQLDAYWTAARKDPTLWPYWFRKLDELSKSSPNEPQVLNALGAVALAEKKDNAKAADYFERALKQGSEEPTTFLNLATALQKLGRSDEEKVVLERGVAAYPYSGPLVAKLAGRYFAEGQTWRARNLVQQYRAVFPEDALVQAAQKQIEGPRNGVEPNRNVPQVQAQ
jgi:tetratricopeptide (TPR) repeat protein